MRLLACFTKRPVVVNLPTDPENQSSAPAITAPPSSSSDSSTSVTLPAAKPPTGIKNKSPVSISRRNILKSSAEATVTAPSKPPASPFVPTSIPELHPEYAHAEPYCFVARTESARVVVDRLRGARGQPAVDHAHILKQQGVTVVRGPSYSAAKAVEIASNPTSPEKSKSPVKSKEDRKEAESQVLLPNAGARTISRKRKTTSEKTLSHISVPLRIEEPTSLGRDIQDSDDEVNDENIDSENINNGNVQQNGADVNEEKPEGAIFSRSRTKSSAKKSSRSANPTSPNKSFRIKSRKSRNKLTKSNGTINAAPETINLTEADSVNKKLFNSDEDAQHSNVRTNHAEDASCNESTDVESEAPKTPTAGHMPTPFEQLIEKHMDNTPTELLAPIMVPRTSIMYGESPLNDVNGVNYQQVPLSITSSQRYADADEDQNEQQYPPTHHPQQKQASAPLNLSALSAAITNDTGDQTSPLQGLRSRRKSKPFLEAISVANSSSVNNLSTFERNVVNQEGKASAKVPFNSIKPVPVPPPVQSNPGILSSEEELGTSVLLADRVEGATNSLPRRESKLLASKPKHVKPLDIPRAAALPPALTRRTSSANAGSRKTVSFQDAAPVIIEPNLRAPSRSVPRSASLAKDKMVGPPSIGSVLSQVRDSVTGFIPLVDVPPDEDDYEQATKTGNTENNARPNSADITEEGDDADDESTTFVPARNDHTQNNQRYSISTSSNNPKPLNRNHHQQETEDEDTIDENDGPASSSQFTDSDAVSQAAPVANTITRGMPTRPTTSAFGQDGKLNHSISSVRTRERSDVSYGSSLDASSMDGGINSSITWNNHRASRRVSARDKVAIKEATRRQSMAVAQAMSQQIRGVPRSAMLAYSKNEILIDDVEDEDTNNESTNSMDENNNELNEASGMESTDDNSTNGIIVVGGHRRRSRKSIMVPITKPGEVPPAPPPPPFSPRKLNIRSVRSPPPPPSSPLPH